MSALTYLFISAIVAVFALMVVSVANQREQRIRMVRQKMFQLKQRLEFLEELVIEIVMLVESKAIAKQINDEIIDLLNAMLKLDPSALYLGASMSNAEKRSEDLSDESTHYPIDRMKESDAKIARAQFQLNEAGKILRKQQIDGKLTLEEYNLFIHQLSWAHLMTDVISHVGQGHRAYNRGDILTAHAFYKKAQQLLIQSSHTDSRRHPMIKELTEIMSGSRRSLSAALMPEQSQNPDQSHAEHPSGTLEEESH